jgi:hypothetical protein
MTPARPCVRAGHAIDARLSAARPSAPPHPSARAAAPLKALPAGATARCAEEVPMSAAGPGNPQHPSARAAAPLKALPAGATARCAEEVP